MEGRNNREEAAINLNKEENRVNRAHNARHKTVAHSKGMVAEGLSNNARLNKEINLLSRARVVLATGLRDKGSQVNREGHNNNALLKTKIKTGVRNVRHNHQKKKIDNDPVKLKSYA